MSPELLFCPVGISRVTKLTSISLSETEAVVSSFNTTKAIFIHTLVPKRKRKSYVYRDLGPNSDIYWIWVGGTVLCLQSGVNEQRSYLTQVRAGLCLLTAM